MMESQWSSAYSGYLQRATPHPDPSNYEFERSSLKLMARVNAMSEADGFSLAVFSDRVAVDHLGSLFILDQEDYNGLISLAEAVSSLPDTQVSLPRSWTVAHDSTCWPNDIIYSPKIELNGVREAGSEGSDSSTEFVETCLYGFHKKKRTLHLPVEQYTEVPDCLWELVGLVREAWPVERGLEENRSVTQVIKKLVK